MAKCQSGFLLQQNLFRIVLKENAGSEMTKKVVFDLSVSRGSAVNFEVIERRLRKFKEVIKISISRGKKQLTVTYTATDDLQESMHNALLKIGYPTTWRRIPLQNNDGHASNTQDEE